SKDKAGPAPTGQPRDELLIMTIINEASPAHNPYADYPGDHIHGPLNGESTNGDVPPSVPERPMVDANCEDLPTITARAWEVLLAANEPPVLFRYGGSPSRIERDDDGVPIIRALTHGRMQHALARAARWIRTKKIGRKDVDVESLPPKSVIEDVL